MAPHVRNYLKFFGFDESSFIPCENCSAKSVEIHHLTMRSKFGSKRKEEQDNAKNCIALCRECHDQAHAKPGFNLYLKEKHEIYYINNLGMR